ncbi:MAG: ATP phosphoribosyltransferase regulatory subunit, partial [Thermoanaerobaculia bacterium]
ACPTLLAVVENGLPDRPEDLGPEAASRLQGLLALQGELATAFPQAKLTIDLAEFACNSLDPELSAGVAEGERPYYDGVVFHAYAGPAALPVGGGGRYDRLFRSLGAEVPAVGFAISLERLLEATSATSGEARP